MEKKFQLSPVPDTQWTAARSWPRIRNQRHPGAQTAPNSHNTGASQQRARLQTELIAGNVWWCGSDIYPGDMWPRMRWSHHSVWEMHPLLETKEFHWKSHYVKIYSHEQRKKINTVFYGNTQRCKDWVFISSLPGTETVSCVSVYVYQKSRPFSRKILAS